MTTLGFFFLHIIEDQEVNNFSRIHTKVDVLEAQKFDTCLKDFIGTNNFVSSHQNNVY